MTRARPAAASPHSDTPPPPVIQLISTNPSGPVERTIHWLRNSDHYRITKVAAVALTVIATVIAGVAAELPLEASVVLIPITIYALLVNRRLAARETEAAKQAERPPAKQPNTAGRSSPPASPARSGGDASDTKGADSLPASPERSEDDEQGTKKAGSHPASPARSEDAPLDAEDAGSRPASPIKLEDNELSAEDLDSAQAALAQFGNAEPDVGSSSFVSAKPTRGSRIMPDTQEGPRGARHRATETGESCSSSSTASGKLSPVPFATPKRRGHRRVLSLGNATPASIAEAKKVLRVSPFGFEALQKIHSVFGKQTAVENQNEFNSYTVYSMKDEQDISISVSKVKPSELPGNIATANVGGKTNRLGLFLKVCSKEDPNGEPSLICLYVARTKLGQLALYDGRKPREERRVNEVTDEHLEMMRQIIAGTHSEYVLWSKPDGAAEGVASGSGGSESKQEEAHVVE